MEKAIVDYCRVGNCRATVFICDWDSKLLPKMKQITGSDIWNKMLTKFKTR